jgi:DNA invertase Pin-like site-specific DNA recombinase
MRIDLYLHRQGINTATPAGKAMYPTLAIFAAVRARRDQERVRAGLRRSIGDL